MTGNREANNEGKTVQAPEVLCIGQAVVDCITRGVEGDPLGMGKTRAGSITLNLGGDAVNESFVLASMGRRAGLICAVGDDLAGRFIQQEAQRRGLDTGGITVVPGLVTPVANMFVALDGSRSSITSKASLLEGYTPQCSLQKGTRVVSFASLFRAPLDRPQVVCELVRAAHESGAVVCADTKIPTYRKMELSEIAGILPMIDYLFPNETEAAFLTGLPATGGESGFDRIGERLLASGVRHVIIKAGEKGCRAYTKEAKYALPAIKGPVVDTTGAGDNFVAGFIDGLLRGQDMKECCESGLRQAAVSIGHLGATG